MAEKLQTSPFYQADGADAPAVQATLTALTTTLANTDAAVAAARGGALTPTQRDNMIADILDTNKKLLLIVLGRQS